MSTSGNGSSYNGPDGSGFPPPSMPPERPDEGGSTTGVWVGVIAAVVVVAVAGVFLITGLGTSDDGDVSVLPGDETTAPTETTDPGTGGEDVATTDPEESATAGPEETTTEPGVEPSPSPTEPTEDAQTTDPDPERDTIGRYDPNDPLAIGDVDAPVTLIEYGDFQCPHCIIWAATYKPELMPLVEDGTLRIEYHDYIVFGPESEQIAAAARAAGEQDLFWEFYDAIAAKTPEGSGADPDRAGLIALAEEIGVPDLDQFEADMDSPEIFEAILEDHAVGVQAGVRGTPTLVLNEELISQTPPVGELITQIEDAAADAG